jgi:hypothetical protein
MPTLCVVISAGALLVLVVVLAWDMWATGVIILCAFTGAMVFLQFIIYGVHYLISFILVIYWVIKRITLFALANIG